MNNIFFIIKKLLLPDLRNGTLAKEDFATEIVGRVKDLGKDVSTIPWDRLFSLYSQHKDAEIEELIKNL